MEDSLLKCLSQVVEFDCPDKGNINNIDKDIMLFWQKIIRQSNQLPEKEMDTDCAQDQSTQSSCYNTINGILEPIFDEMKMSEEFLTKIEKNRLGENPQTVILYDIVHDRLFLNYLQRIVVKEALNQAIDNKRHQCRDKSDQFLLYVREKWGVGKSKVIKAIYLKFSFLKK